MEPLTFGKGTALPRPLIIAHRGASGYAPENTLAAIEKAIALGAHMVELDIHQTKDGIPVVLHDSSLWRTAGIRRNVGSLTLQELKRLEVGSWFNPQFQDERIPTLEEVLERVQSRILLNLELKQGISPYPSFTDHIMKLLDHYQLLSLTILSSFSPGSIMEFHKKNPDIPIGHLSRREATLKIFQKAENINACSLHIPFRKISPDLLNQAHARGFRVFTYTVNRSEEMLRFLRMGVDGIFTNFPDRFSKILEKLDQS